VKGFNDPDSPDRPPRWFPNRKTGPWVLGGAAALAGALWLLRHLGVL
jgi:hypothetical protein